MSKTKQIVLRIVEITLLVPAFSTLIPPVPSQAGYVYHLFPGFTIGIILFALSQAVSIYRDRQSWWAAILKLILFIAFGWIVFERIIMGPMN